MYFGKDWVIIVEMERIKSVGVKNVWEKMKNFG